MSGPEEVAGPVPVVVIRPPLCHEVDMPEVRPWACEEHAECRGAQLSLLCLTIETIILCALFREYVGDPVKHAGKGPVLVMLMLVMTVNMIGLAVVEHSLTKAISSCRGRI